MKAQTWRMKVKKRKEGAGGNCLDMTVKEDQRKSYLEEFFLEIFADKCTNIYKFLFQHYLLEIP